MTSARQITFQMEESHWNVRSIKRKKKRTRMKMEIRSNSKHNADGRRVNNTEEGEKLSREFFFFPSKRVNGAFDVFRGPESRNLVA